MVEQRIAHRITRLIAAFAIGVAVAIYAYHRVTDPEPARQRVQEEAAVLESREILATYLGSGPELQIVDPLAPDRMAGKVYVYPTDQGFDVSGHYRRNATDRWHPFLMRLDRERVLLALTLGDDDEELQRRSSADPRLRLIHERPAG